VALNLVVWPEIRQATLSKKSGICCTALACSTSKTGQQDVIEIESGLLTMPIRG
jgi:hypothetical protein